MITKYEEEYLKKTGDWHIADSEWKAKKVYEMMKRNNLLNIRSIYDVGCGAGEVLASLQKILPDNVELRGFDISETAISMAKTRETGNLGYFKIDFLKVPLLNADLILCLDVIEHIPNYKGFLRDLVGRSKHIIFHIPIDDVLYEPEYKDHMKNTYGHLHFWNESQALQMIYEIFDVKDYFYTDDYEIPTKNPIQINNRRQKLFEIQPQLATYLYSHFNVMILGEQYEDN